MHHRLISGGDGDNVDDGDDVDDVDDNDDAIDEVENQKMGRVDESCLAHLRPSSPA